MRVVSFLPAATEIIFALGLGDALVGVTDECDYPAEARTKPIVVKPAVDLKALSLGEIDRTVATRLRDGKSLYQVDEKQFRELAPDLILTQDLCQVCALSGNEITQTLDSLPKKPAILSLSPRSLKDVLQNIVDIGNAVDCAGKADAYQSELRTRLDDLHLQTKLLPAKRVLYLEWVDPLYNAGHWVPEMMKMAGGVDDLGSLGQDSVRIQWDDVTRWAPEVLVVGPCGFGAEDAARQAKTLAERPGWKSLPAVQSGKVFAVDANSYFARPGPRLIDGAELLAHLVHPAVVDWEGPPSAFRRIS